MKPVTYVDLHQHLQTLGAKQNELDILRPDTEKSSVSMYQCSADIAATERSISASSDDSFVLRMREYFQFVLEEQPSLVLTPEYSMPWSLIDSLLTEKLSPRDGAIWVLGCESCTPQELRELMDKHSSIIWHSELDNLTESPGSFLDPLVIVFQISINNEPKTFICVQFKATQMGGDHEAQIEGNNLIRGKTRYIVRNPLDSICLLPLICSDVFLFDNSHFDGFRNYPFLICHLQMTKDPFHDRFSKYRNDIIDSPAGNRIELLTLNWASRYSINGMVQSDECGGSGYYMKPDRFDREPSSLDDTINNNHSSGIYLKLCDEKRYAAYYFSNQECILHFYVRKVWQELAADVAQISRYGATAINTYTWEQQNSNWKPSKGVCDGIESIAKEIHEPLCNILKISPLDRERLVRISLGQAKFKSGTPWHSPRQLPGLKISRLENPSGSMVRLRQSQVEEIENSFTGLKYLVSDILPRLTEFTKNHKKVADPSLELGFTDSLFQSNVKIGEKNKNAIIAYVGEIPEHRAKQIFDAIFSHSKQKRVIVIYRSGDDKKFLESEHPKIDEGSPNPADITGA